MTRLVLTVFCFVAVLAVVCSAGTPDQNKALIGKFVEIGNSRDLDRLPEVVVDDFERHCQATPGLVIDTLDKFRKFMEADVKVCPDSQVEVQQMVAEDDRVAIWATYTGTQTGVMGPFPPSGKTMVLDFGAIFRLEDGKIAELWVVWDNMAALTQLGHFPPKAAK